MKTKAAVLRGANQPLEIEEVDLSPPRPREVLVEMVSSGICHSDLHIINGAIPANLPIICGHEGAGIVREVGPGVIGVAVGDHVVLAWAPTCGRCVSCAEGHPNLCETTIGPSYDGVLWDGTSRFHDAAGTSVSHHLMVSSFSRHVVVPDGGAIPVRRDVPLASLALIGCAVATGVGAVTNSTSVGLGSTVAVIGLGAVGMNAIQGARLRGASRIIAVDISPEKLEKSQLFGATEMVQVTSDEDGVAALLDLTGGRGVDVAVEAVGTPGTVSAAFRSLRRGGTAVIIGLASPGTMVNVDLYELISDRRLVGSYYGGTRPLIDIPRLVDLYTTGRLLIDELITEEVDQADINQSLERLERGQVLRSLIRY